MTTNVIAVSRRLAGAGMEKQVAEAITEEIMTRSGEHLTTRADIAGIKGEFGALKVELNAFKAEFRSQIKMLTSLIIGLYLGLALLLAISGLADFACDARDSGP